MRSQPALVPIEPLPMATPLVAIITGGVVVALGCSKGSLAFFFPHHFNTCRGVGTTRHKMHASDIGWDALGGLDKGERWV